MVGPLRKENIVSSMLFGFREVPHLSD